MKKNLVFLISLFISSSSYAMDVKSTNDWKTEKRATIIFHVANSDAAARIRSFYEKSNNEQCEDVDTWWRKQHERPLCRGLVGYEHREQIKLCLALQRLYNECGARPAEATAHPERGMLFRLNLECKHLKRAEKLFRKSPYVSCLAVDNPDSLKELVH